MDKLATLFNEIWWTGYVWPVLEIVIYILLIVIIAVF